MWWRNPTTGKEIPFPAPIVSRYKWKPEFSQLCKKHKIESHENGKLAERLRTSVGALSALCRRSVALSALCRRSVGASYSSRKCGFPVDSQAQTACERGHLVLELREEVSGTRRPWRGGRGETMKGELPQRVAEAADSKEIFPERISRSNDPLPCRRAFRLPVSGPPTAGHA